MSPPAKRSSNEARSKRKRSPKEAWRLVDAGCSDSSTDVMKENPVSKLATRTSDARWSRLFGRIVSKTESSADSVRCPALGTPITRRPTDSAANPIASAAIPDFGHRRPKIAARIVLRGARTAVMHLQTQYTRGTYAPVCGKRATLLGDADESRRMGGTGQQAGMLSGQLFGPGGNTTPE